MRGAEDGGDGVGEEDSVKAGDGVVGCDEAGAFGDGDEGAEVVKEVDEEEDENDFKQAFVESAGDIELESGCGEGLKATGGGGPVDEGLRPVIERAGVAGEVKCAEGEGPGRGRDGDNANEDGAFHFADLEGDHQDEAGEGERGCRVADVAETDERGGIADDEAGVAKADEGDEEADAAGDGCVEFVRDGAEQGLSFGECRRR